MDEKGIENGVFYSVSEAVQRIGAPQHVLRYWEEELEIPIKRNSLGHRLYGESDIELFRWVKRLKDSGIQLKAIRMLLKEELPAEGAVDFEKGEAGVRPDVQADARPDVQTGGSFQNEVPPSGSGYEVIPAPGADRFSLFQTILRNLMEEVAQEQNAKLRQSLEAAFRTEAEALYLQFCQEAKREAAAADDFPVRTCRAGSGRAPGRLLAWLRKRLTGRI